MICHGYFVVVSSTSRNRMLRRAATEFRTKENVHRWGKLFQAKKIDQILY
jgi:hypothetical protein